MAERASGALAKFADALGHDGLDEGPSPEPAAGRLAKLAARSGHTRLSTLGVEEARLPEVAAAAVEHPGVAMTPDPPGEEELLGLLRAAL